MVIVGAISVKIVADVSDLIGDNKSKEIADQGLNTINVVFKWLPLVAMGVVSAVVLLLLLASLMEEGKR